MDVLGFLVVIWCYTCDPMGWTTNELKYAYKTRAECEYYLNNEFHSLFE
jgi:hypothetical protein